MDSILTNPTYIWLGLSILLFFIEAITVNLVTIWLGAGALGGMIAAMLGAGTTVQIIVFLVISAVLIFFTRPLAMKYIKKIPTNQDRLIGKSFIVTQTIDNMSATGQVKADGKFWTARSADGSVIPEGEVITVAEIAGVKLIVNKK